MKTTKGLNPYSIGIWSATLRVFAGRWQNMVLILILLEYGLRHAEAILQNGEFAKVLILILLEYGLRHC